jgi:alkylation response protein AidB-like acyl-CoA dehydrogenase
MDFDISSDQQMLQNTVSDFLANIVDANALVRFDATEMDELRAKIDTGLFGMALAGILVPPENGGVGMDLLTLSLVAEELGHKAGPTGIIRNTLAAWLLSKSGSETQKGTWLPGLLDGTKRAAFAIQDGGWMPENWTASTTQPTAAKRNVEGAQDADVFIVGLDGGQLGLVESGSVEIEVRGEPLDATRPAADISFPSSAIESIVGSDSFAEALRDAQLVVHAADAYGAGLRALELSNQYAQTRQQFDRAIGSFQGLKHQLANLALEVHPARFLSWYAAHAWDEGADDAAYSCALAKAHVPDVAVRCGRASVEAHGGIGYTWEYPLHLFLKRAMFDREAWAGVDEHRTRVAALAGW